MSLVKVVTRKEIDWKGRAEEYTNVYYFGDGNLTNPSEAEALALVDKVIAQERSICSSAVRFLGGLAYVGWNTIGDTAALARRELVGINNTGTLAVNSNMYKECAVDFKFLLGGKRVLRSLIHTCNPLGLDVRGETAGVPVAAATTFAGNMAGSTFYAPFRRMAPNGDTPGGFVVEKFLEHRQFHRYRWRYD